MQLGSWKTEQQAPQKTNCQTVHGSQKTNTLRPACMVLISTDIPHSTPPYRHPPEIHRLVRDRQKLKQDCCWEDEGVHTSRGLQRCLKIMKCWKPCNYTIFLGSVTSRKEITDISFMWQNAKIFCLFFPLNMKSMKEGRFAPMSLFSHFSHVWKSRTKMTTPHSEITGLLTSRSCINQVQVAFCLLAATSNREGKHRTGHHIFWKCSLKGRIAQA